MDLKILTPEWNRSVEGAASVLLPGSYSPFEILPGHAAIISTLDVGKVVWRTSDGEEALAIRGGVVRVHNDVVELCVEPE